MKNRKILGLLLLSVVALGVVGASGAPAPKPNGATLFNNYCANCHSAGGLQGVTSSQIKQAINTVPAMSGLTSLSNADRRAIASYLSGK